MAILVYAYLRGGSGEAGIAAFVQLAPAALLAPLAGAAADRLGGVRMLTVGYALQTLTMASTAVALALAASPWVVFTVAATAAVSVTMTRPTQAVVTPALSRTPLELGAVNVLSGWITAAGGLVAPALAGLLVAVANPASVFFAAAGAVATATILATRIPRAAHTESTATAAVRQSLSDVSAGLRAGS